MSSLSPVSAALGVPPAPARLGEKADPASALRGGEEPQQPQTPLHLQRAAPQPALEEVEAERKQTQPRQPALKIHVAYDEENHRFVVEVIDSATGDVIRKLPLEASKQSADELGVFFDGKG